MTGEDFTAWMAHVGWNVSKTATAFDMSRNTVAKYLREGAPDHVAYACAAIAFGLPKWQSAQ